MISPKLLLLSLLLSANGLLAETVLEATGELPADARDANGDTIGGIGSGLVYEPKEDLFYCISDRGPGDGTLPYRPRIVVLKIRQDGKTLHPEIVRSIILQDEKGRAMTGLIPDDRAAAYPAMKDGRTCIDPEAISFGPDGTFFVTDEYGPLLYQFDAKGIQLRRIDLPAEFQPRTAEGKLDYSDKAELTTGRTVNQGPEGMCLIPGQNTAALIFQSALTQDGGRQAGTSKLLLLDLATGKPSAAYQYLHSPDIAGPDAKKLSVNDLVALDEHRFLVLERDGLGRDGSAKPQPALYKTVWLIDTRTATNLLTSPSSDPVVPLSKQLLFNLATLADPATLSAKWEGIAILPSSSDELTLMMSADNDFLSPIIYEDGKTYPFPRAEDAVPAQFFKIRTSLPVVSGGSKKS